MTVLGGYVFLSTGFSDPDQRSSCFSTRKQGRPLYIPWDNVYYLVNPQAPVSLPRYGMAAMRAAILSQNNAVCIRGEPPSQETPAEPDPTEGLWRTYSIVAYYVAERFGLDVRLGDGWLGGLMQKQQTLAGCCMLSFGASEEALPQGCLPSDLEAELAKILPFRPLLRFQARFLGAQNVDLFLFQ